MAESSPRGPHSRQGRLPVDSSFPRSRLLSRLHSTMQRGGGGGQFERQAARPQRGPTAQPLRLTVSPMPDERPIYDYTTYTRHPFQQAYQPNGSRRQPA